MPDEKKSLLRKPKEKNENPYKGQSVSLKTPWRDEGAFTKFMGGFTGDAGEGAGLPAVLGMALGTLNPLDDLTRFVKGAKGTARMAEFASVEDPRSVSKFIEGTPVNLKDPGRIRDRQVTNEFPRARDQYSYLTNDPSLHPDVAAEMGRLMGEMIPNPTIQAAFKEFAARSPEAAGHVSKLSTEFPKMRHEGLLDTITEALGLNTLGLNKGSVEGPHFSEVYINPKALPHRLSKNMLADTTGHELQHAYQQHFLGREADAVYNMHHNKVGYDKNPLEIDARHTGSEIAKKVKEARKKK